MVDDTVKDRWQICERCRRYFDPATGDIPEGWGLAKFVETDNAVCRECSIEDEKARWP